MQCINELGRSRCFRYPVKYETMCDIFKKRPEKYTTEKNEQNGFSGIIIGCRTCINEKTQDRDVHSPDH